MRFFEELGDEITIENKDHFALVNEKLGGYVHKRTHDSSEEERWVFFRFIEYQIMNRTLVLPVTIRKSEQPDLLVYQGAKEPFGIEITESTNPLYLAARALAQKRRLGEWPIDSYFKGSKRLSQKSSRRLIGRDGGVCFVVRRLHTRSMRPPHASHTPPSRSATLGPDF